MCRSENEPGGPYRCSADMQNILMSAQAHYAATTMEWSSLVESTEALGMQIERMEEMVNQDPQPSRQMLVQLDHLSAQHAELAAKTAEREQEAAMWREKVKKAQRDYDSTRGGISDLNAHQMHLMVLISSPDILDEDKARYEAEMERVQVRLDDALNTIHTERKKPLEEEAEREGATGGTDYDPIDSSKDSPSEPTGSESDVLIHPELDAHLDAMIDELELSGVDKRYLGIIDPETGEEYDEHEITVMARQSRREARMRLRREARAEGSTRELLRVFLREAIYRSLRRNKHTRHIVRLIGVGNYNAFLDKLADVRLEKQDRRVERAQSKWRQRRMGYADTEKQNFEHNLADARVRYGSKIERENERLAAGKISESRHAYLVAAHERALADVEKAVAAGLLEIENFKAAWILEEAQEADREKRKREDIAKAIQQKRAHSEETRRLMDMAR